MPGEYCRRRAYSPKVTTGCLTCKARKVKCDEGLPSCKICSKTGRKCGGYVKIKTTPSFTPQNDSLNTISLSSDIGGSGQEIRSLQFFRSFTVPQLCGLFESSFWERLVLQAAHHEPAVRHAAIALGSLHEDLESNLSTGHTYCGNEFTLQQYLKAIKCLTHPKQGQISQNVDLALMTCVLFVCFEMLRAHHGSALAHINSAIKILVELQSNTNSSEISWNMPKNSYVPLSTLNLIFSRLEAQLLLVNGASRLLIGGAMDDGEAGYQSHIPDTFSSLAQARNSLDHIWTAHARYVREARPSPQSIEIFALVDRSKRISAAKLLRWSDTFEAFLRRNSRNFDTAHQITIHVLKAQRIMAGIIFSIDDHIIWAHSEMHWDDYFLEYQAIIHQSAAVVKLESQLSKSRGVKSAFTLDSGITLPLLIVATKCRHRVLRRKAIAILKSTPRLEGFIPSVLTGKIAERVVEIELESFPEAQCPEDIPNSARVAHVYLYPDTRRSRVVVQYTKWRQPGAIESHVITEFMEWEGD